MGESGKPLSQHAYEYRRYLKSFVCVACGVAVLERDFTLKHLSAWECLSPASIPVTLVGDETVNDMERDAWREGYERGKKEVEVFTPAQRKEATLDELKRTRKVELDG